MLAAWMLLTRVPQQQPQQLQPPPQPQPPQPPPQQQQHLQQQPPLVGLQEIQLLLLPLQELLLQAQPDIETRRGMREENNKACGDLTMISTACYF